MDRISPIGPIGSRRQALIHQAGATLSLGAGRICAYRSLITHYGLRISRKHRIKSFSDLLGVHELRYLKMAGLGS